MFEISPIQTWAPTIDPEKKVLRFLSKVDNLLANFMVIQNSRFWKAISQNCMR